MKTNESTIERMKKILEREFSFVTDGRSIGYDRINVFFEYGNANIERIKRIEEITKMFKSDFDIDLIALRDARLKVRISW